MRPGARARLDSYCMRCGYVTYAGAVHRIYAPPGTLRDVRRSSYEAPKGTRDQALRQDEMADEAVTVFKRHVSSRVDISAHPAC